MGLGKGLGILPHLRQGAVDLASHQLGHDAVNEAPGRPAGLEPDASGVEGSPGLVGISDRDPETFQAIAYASDGDVMEVQVEVTFEALGVEPLLTPLVDPIPHLSREIVRRRDVGHRRDRRPRLYFCRMTGAMSTTSRPVTQRPWKGASPKA